MKTGRDKPRRSLESSTRPVPVPSPNTQLEPIHGKSDSDWSNPNIGNSSNSVLRVNFATNSPTQQWNITNCSSLLSVPVSQIKTDRGSGYHVNTWYGSKKYRFLNIRAEKPLLNYWLWCNRGPLGLFIHANYHTVTIMEYRFSGLEIWHRLPAIILSQSLERVVFSGNLLYRE